MLGLFMFLLFIAIIVGIIGLIKGSLKLLRIPNRKTALVVSVASFVLMLVVAGMMDTPEEGAAENIIEEIELEEEIDEVEETHDAESPEAEPIEEEIEPEPIPDAITFSGSGDDVIMIEKPEEGPVVLYIKGNSESRHFAITGYDENDNRTNLFVNTTDPYEGITLDPGGTTALLEISGQGAWEIESRSMRSLRVLEAPGTIEGSGDEVIQVVGDASLATVNGNAEGRHFSIIGYNPNRNLMVNTTDPYEGKVRVANGTFLLEITSVGDWSVSME